MCRQEIASMVLVRCPELTTRTTLVLLPHGLCLLKTEGFGGFVSSALDTRLPINALVSINALHLLLQLGGQLVH